ncbi:MAG: leucine-rich repeat domain-containing protein [Acutalibacteraceae bacterium]
MSGLRKIWLRAFLLAAIVAAGAVASCLADTVYDCFEVTLYSPSWHVQSTLDGFTDRIDIAIDDNEPNGWEALNHGSMSVCYLAGASVNETVNADTFAGMNFEVEFPNQSDFIVAFVVGCSSATSIDGYFGWFRAAYEGGAIVLKGGALNTERGGSIIAGIEEPASDIAWRTVDHGDWLELAENCIPSDTSGRVVIPREINGKPMTSIGEAAFYGCGQITSLQIPNLISNIGCKAFSGCIGITSLSVPSSVTNLGESTFFDCNYLQTLSLHGPATIVSNAVWGLPQLQSIEFGAGVRTNCGGAIYGCLHLASLTIPGDVERIEPGAFTLCENLATVSVHWLTIEGATRFLCRVNGVMADVMPRNRPGAGP